MAKDHVLKAKKTKKEKQDLTLEDVIDLGGDKKDYELVLGIEDDVEDIDMGEDWNAETIGKDELRSFIQTLGLKKLKDKEEPEESKPKKVKLLVAKEDDTVTEESEVPEKKKKSKNKFKKEEEAEEESEVAKKKKKNKNKFKKEDEKPEVQSNEVSSSSEAKRDKLEFFDDFQQQRTELLFKTGTPWHEQFKEDFKGEISDEGLVSKALQYGERLLDQEAALYKKQQEKHNKSESRWMRTVLTSGTLGDRVAAYTLQAQQSPIHGLHAVQKLIDMLNKKGKRESLMALDSLKELFVHLLPDRKLRTMKQHPLQRVESLASGNKDSRDKRLVLWYFEDKLRELYAGFVEAVKTLSHDTVVAAKKKAISAAHHLLSSKPELEKEWLSLLVNKLGDPDFKTASKAGHLLTALVEMHPNMKRVVVEEVERLLFRPNISAKAQYYGVCFMNQLMFQKSESALASKLIAIYFSLFGAFVKKGDVDSKMLRALLTGVNRAYPFAKVDRVKIEEQMNTIYKVVHVVNFQTSIQALLLLHQVTDSSDSMCERFYSALYRKLLDPALHSSNKQALFLNLLFRSMDKDVQDTRVKAFCKRLLQVCCHQPVPFVCGALVLLSEIVKKRPHLLKFNKIAEDIDSDDEEHFKDVLDSDDEEEHYMDVVEEENDEETEEKTESEVALALQEKGHTTTAPGPPSWVHRNNQPRGDKSSVDYDMLHRNPLYCHADQECTWELRRLASHLHPTVSLFAKHLLAGEKIKYSGDPLEDFTLINFLNRFVYRNPKKVDASAKQPKTKRATLPSTGIKTIPVNSKEYLQLGEETIPAHEKFMFKYFSQEANRKQEHTVTDADSDAESVDDDEFDRMYLDNYEKSMTGGDYDMDFDIAGEFKKPKPKKSGDEDGDDDDEEDEDDDNDNMGDMDDLSDEEIDFDPSEMAGMFGDDDDDDDDDGDGDMLGFDEEGVEFSDDDDELPGPSSKKRKKEAVDDMMDMDFMKNSSGSSKKSKSKNSSDLFAAAEEFSHLMDENGDSKFDMIGSDAMANKDNASVKQLRWEADRDKFVRGKHWKNNKPRRGGPKGKRPNKPRRK